MTRMFLRFYLGVVTILVFAWLVLAYVYRADNAAQNIQVIEEALGGGVRLAREKFVAANPGEASQVLDAIRSEFDYPVQIVAWVERPMSESLKTRLHRGDVVLNGNRMLAALPDETSLLSFGPLPEFARPDQTEILLGIGVIFGVAALAIAILLRPVVTQLRAIERTASAFSEGDLSARLDMTQTPKGIAFALAFNKMADRVETLLRSQRELLQAVSHELRTPLAKIRFATELIESSETDDERRLRLESVNNATEKLDGLVSELLNYVRLESVVVTSELTSVDLRQLILEVIDLHAPLHPAIELQIECADISLLSNRGSLSVAIGNLVSNAARFASSRVSVSAVRGGERVTIRVDDDGPGIPETQWERVFEPFVRLDESNQRGTGLGLALVQRIAIRVGGHASVGTSPLGGARFTLELPL